MRLMIVRLVFAILVACGLAGTASAICTTSSPPLSFASGSTYDVKTGSIATVTGSAGLYCSGTALNVLGTGYARATLNGPSTLTLTNANGYSIPFVLAADQNFTYQFTPGSSIDYYNTTLLSLLNILNPNSFSPPLYAKLGGTPNVPAGTYTASLNIQWNWKVCSGINVLSLLCAGYETGSSTSTILLSVTISQDCRINAPNVSFGSAPLASQFQPVSQAVLVDCSLGSTYKVSFSSGGNGTARPWRTMSDGAGHTLQYNIYLPDGTTIWDTTNPQQSTVNAGKGTGSDTPSQMQSYVAKVNTAQTTPPAGSYSDTVNVIITF